MQNIYFIISDVSTSPKMGQVYTTLVVHSDFEYETLKATASDSIISVAKNPSKQKREDMRDCCGMLNSGEISVDDLSSLLD